MASGLGLEVVLEASPFSTVLFWPRSEDVEVVVHIEALVEAVVVVKVEFRRMD